jgi:hypothetical protein
VVAAPAQIVDPAMRRIIQIIGLASGEPSEADGQYVRGYTPDGHDGRGDLVLTRHRGQAKRYPSTAAAMSELRRVSATHPTRVDGKPNRPLSAFNVSIEEDDD